MKTNKPIVWSILASSDFNQILDYLFQKWNSQIAIHFIDLVDNQLQTIAHRPKLYPEINKKKKVRKCVVTKHNTLYYRETSNKIEVVRLFDNRQNPKKLSF
ncbi:MAG: type II toxin-antitoxin system RelE/ParE family toxin [Bacteroidales bacterium]|nr:type II toxin-antitoxin system RelE/ParE family toxin [Bacteroidales bacterium]